MTADIFADLCGREGGREGLQRTSGARRKVQCSKARGSALSMSLMAR